MTDIEQKALALVNEVARELGWGETKEIFAAGYTRNEALFRAIEKHEAFRQEVSDALLEYYGGYHNASGETLECFIIPKPKPDPLVDVLKDFGGFMPDADDFRAALEARGLEIREKGG